MKKAKDDRQSSKHASKTRELVTLYLRNKDKAHAVLCSAIAENNSTLLKVFLEATKVYGPFRKALHPKPFPSSASSLGLLEDLLIWTPDLRTNLLLSLYAVLPYAEDINRHLADLAECESKILLGDYDGASAKVGKMNVKGHSLWSVQITLTVQFLAGGAEAAYNRLAIIEAEASNNSFLRFFLSSHISRLEQSFDQYRQMTRWLKTYTDEQDTEENKRYIAYQCLRLRVPSLEPLPMSVSDINNLLYFDRQVSVTDRYIGLRMALTSLLLEPSQGHRNLACEIINLMTPAIRDPWLEVNVNFLRGRPICARPQPLGDILRDGYRGYYEGEYMKVLNTIMLHLEEYPGCFTLYDLLSRCSAYCQNEFSQIKASPNLRSLVLASLTNFHKHSAETEVAYSVLRQTAQQTIGLGIASQIELFIYEPLLDKHLQKVGPPLLSENPDIAAVLPSIICKTMPYLYQDIPLLAGNSQGPSVPMFSCIVTQQPLFFADVGQFDNDWLALFDSDESTPQERREALKWLLRSAQDAGVTNSMIRLISHAYVREPNILLGLDLSHLVETAESVRLGEIDWPIALYASQRFYGVDYYKLYTAFDQFLSAHGVDRPSQLDTQSPSGISHDKMAIFWAKICIPEVMDSSVSFEDTRSVENERIEILRKLCTIDPVNAETYTSESIQIIRNQSIREAIQYVDTSKIFVHTERIKERFVVNSPDIVSRSVSLQDRQTAASGRTGFRLQPFAERLISGLFKEVKEMFLNDNNFGLDAYLSTRVRHGTLAGDLRSLVERHKLATQRDKEGRYASNHFWVGQLRRHSVDPEQIQALEDLLSKFSRVVDDIIEITVKEWVHIRRSEKPNGMFDYEYSRNELAEQLAHVLVSASDGSHVVDLLIQLLWHRTEKCLARVRSRITGELQNMFLAALDELEQGSGGLVPVTLSLWRTTIARCRTDLQHQLIRTAEWFTNSDRSSARDFDLAVLCDSCLTFIRRIHPDVSIQPRVNANRVGLIQGRFLEHFFSILTILLENAVRHATSLANDFEVSAALIDHQIELRLQNTLELDAGLDIARIIGDINQMNDLPSLSLIRTEGGSGFPKIHNILRHDLNALTYEVTVSLSDSLFITEIKFYAGGILREDSHH